MSLRSDDAISRRIRHRLRLLLRRRRGRRNPVADFFDRLGEVGAAGFLFGGAPRDLLLAPPGKRPRDLDIVVTGLDPSEAEDLFGHYCVGRTRYGGYRLLVGDWPVDVWTVDSTWAIRTHALFFTNGFQDLPRTTFLNIEAVLVSISPGSHGTHDIVDGGFYEAVRSRRLELNFEPTVSVELCVARALYVATKLNFKIGPRLSRYLSRARQTSSIDAVIAAQMSHYGRIRLERSELDRLWAHVVTASLEGNGEPIELPLKREVQLLLWDTEGN